MRSVCVSIAALAIGAGYPPAVSRAADPPAISRAEKPDARAALRPLLDAIRQVESGGRANPPDGDGGRAIGPYQIWRVYWIDARLPGDYQDCRRADYAERVMLAYWARYCPRALEARDFETLARVHNGGPSGARKAATVKYWRKVQSQLGR